MFLDTTKDDDNGVSDGFLDEKIPELYATENVPVEKKMIYRRYQHQGAWILLADCRAWKGMEAVHI